MLKSHGVPVLTWWEKMVKPGIKKLSINRSKELNKEKRSELTLLTWLYADQFEKPEELILYRPSNHGGLGMHHVKFKALAILIRSFLETAVNPKFLHNLFHSSLYKYYVLLQQDTPDPGLPPYYS